MSAKAAVRATSATPGSATVGPGRPAAIPSAARTSDSSGLRHQAGEPGPDEDRRGGGQDEDAERQGGGGAGVRQGHRLRRLHHHPPPQPGDGGVAGEAGVTPAR